MNRTLVFVLAAFLWNSCSAPQPELRVDATDILKAGAKGKLVVTRTASGSNQTNIAGQDNLRYEFTLVNNQTPFEILEGRHNDRCAGSESNVQSNGKLTNILNRSILFEEGDNGEILVSIDCHPNLFKLTSSDSIMHIRLVVVDTKNIGSSDTVRLKLIR